MKFHLKGLHTVRRRLAGGGESVHHYAWRGGPKLTAKPGTAAFVAEFAALTAERDKPDHHIGTLQALINAYQQDPDFLTLKDVTRKGYIQRIRHIEAKFGTMPIKVLNDPRVRGDFLEWRAKVAQENGPREADYRISVLARILSWAHHHRRIVENHLTRPKRIHSGNRREHIWDDASIAKFRAVAGPHIDLPFTLGLETGQREVNILDLRWSNYDGTHLRLRQTKTGRNVVIPLMSDMRARLDLLKVGRQPDHHICLNSRGEPWTTDGFKTSFGKAKDLARQNAITEAREKMWAENDRDLTPEEVAAIFNLTFHDTRGTAVVNLARAGSTVPEIVSITGHSLRDAENILSAHYLSADRELSDSAIRKMENYRAAKQATAAGLDAQA